MFEFIKERYDSAYANLANSPLLGMYIGGYSKREFFSESYTFEFPSSVGISRILQPVSKGKPIFGASWFGQTNPLSRLIKGYDPIFLNDIIKKMGVEQDVVQNWVNSRGTDLRLVFDGMPLQDAIDFANWAVQVVIGAFRFSSGPPLCGGATDIAVITPTAFRWAQRKQWAIIDDGGHYDHQRSSH